MVNFLRSESFNLPTIDNFDFGTSIRSIRTCSEIPQDYDLRLDEEESKSTSPSSNLQSLHVVQPKLFKKYLIEV